MVVVVAAVEVEIAVVVAVVEVVIFVVVVVAAAAAEGTIARVVLTGSKSNAIRSHESATAHRSPSDNRTGWLGVKHQCLTDRQHADLTDFQKTNRMVDDRARKKKPMRIFFLFIFVSSAALLSLAVWYSGFTVWVFCHGDKLAP